MTVVRVLTTSVNVEGAEGLGEDGEGVVGEAEGGLRMTGGLAMGVGDEGAAVLAVVV